MGPDENEWSLYATVHLDDGRTLETIMHLGSAVRPTRLSAKLRTRMKQLTFSAGATRSSSSRPP